MGEKELLVMKISGGENILDKLYNVGRQEEAIGNMISFKGVARNVYRSVEPISVQKVKNALDMLKSGVVVRIDEITREMIKNGGECVVEWVEKIYCMVFESGTIVIVSFYKSWGNKGECKNFRRIRLLGVIDKVYGRILIDRVKSLIDGIIDDD